MKIYGNTVPNLPPELTQILTKGFPPKYPTLNQEKKPKQHGEPES